ncbi:MAG: phosphoesterase [Planctomycetota bacterium]
MSTEEHILVIPASFIDAIGKIDGFEPDVDRFLSPILNSDQLSFQPRGPMEVDPSYKQLIPYCVMTSRDPNGLMKVFTYTRGGGGGEARLHAKRSVGIGGHISQEDEDSPGNTYLVGMQRELNEEVTINASYTESKIGLIYDPSTEVGQVHLGVVHLFHLNAPEVCSNEADLAEGEFLSIDELRAQFDRLETWSQLVLEHLGS